MISAFKQNFRKFIIFLISILSIAAVFLVIMQLINARTAMLPKQDSMFSNQVKVLSGENLDNTQIHSEAIDDEGKDKNITLTDIESNKNDTQNITQDEGVTVLVK